MCPPLPSFQLKFNTLVLCLLTLTVLNGCGTQNFVFRDVEKDLKSRLAQMQLLQKSQADLETRIVKLEEQIPKDMYPLPEEFKSERVENYESRFGLGYPWMLNDRIYSAQQKSQLAALQRQVNDLGSKLEPIFKLEAKIRVLERRVKSKPESTES